MLVGMAQHLIWFGRSRQLHTFLRTLNMKIFYSLLVICFLNTIKASNMEQGTLLKGMLTSELQNQQQSLKWSLITVLQADHHDVGEMTEDLIIGGLPGQPLDTTFQQYSGYIMVDDFHGRSLLYYFVEAQHSPASRPVILWLNGGPGCSSIGIGAMVEIGPFGVERNGSVLSLHQNQETGTVVLNPGVTNIIAVPKHGQGSAKLNLKFFNYNTWHLVSFTRNFMRLPRGILIFHLSHNKLAT